MSTGKYFLFWVSRRRIVSISGDVKKHKTFRLTFQRHSFSYLDHLNKINAPFSRFSAYFPPLLVISAPAKASSQNFRPDTLKLGSRSSLTLRPSLSSFNRYQVPASNWSDSKCRTGSRPEAKKPKTSDLQVFLFSALHSLLLRSTLAYRLPSVNHQFIYRRTGNRTGMAHVMPLFVQNRRHAVLWMRRKLILTAIVVKCICYLMITLKSCSRWI